MNKLTNKDLRNKLAETLSILETTLPAINDGFLLSQEILRELVDHDPKLAKKIRARFEDLKTSSTGLVVEPTAIIQDYIRHLRDDSLWED